MTQSLFDCTGTAILGPACEASFVAVAEGGAVGAFSLTLALTGVRISEVLALTPERINTSNEVIIFETLKQCERGIFRAVPIPRQLLAHIAGKTQMLQSDTVGNRLWSWGRTTAWKRVKRVMKVAGILMLCASRKLSGMALLSMPGKMEYR